MNKNISMITEIAKGLKEFNNDVVFVGGATASLYFYDKNSSEIRPTEDVDCIIEIAGMPSYQLFNEKILKLGFMPDTTPKAPICRYKYLGITVDIMPTDEKILGFSNKWYQEGYSKKIQFELPNKTKVFILPLAYFVATKIEAFLSRGINDPRFSSDLEDLVILLAHVDKEKILEDSSDELEKYIRKHFSNFLSNNEILEAIRGHNPYPNIVNSIDKILTGLKL